MKRRMVSILVSGALAFTMTGVPSAQAAKSYGSCDALHKRWQYGVAKSRKAARRQVRTGHYKPHVSRAGYLANSNLDADKDGTACEVLK